MSLNRENVLWQSADGTWNRAAYDFYESSANRDSDDWDDEPDPEWDVEYTGDFHWASCGHATRDAALASWNGPNPGGYVEMSVELASGLSPEERSHFEKVVAEYDAAAAMLELRAKGVLSKEGMHHWVSFEGRSRVTKDTLTDIAEGVNKVLAKSIVNQEYYRLNGYANDERPRQKEMRDERNRLLELLEQTGEFTDSDYDNFMDRQYDRVLTGLRELETKTRDQRAGSRRLGYGYSPGPPPPSIVPLEELIATIQLERNELQDSMRHTTTKTSLPVPTTKSAIGKGGRVTCGHWMPRAKRNCSLAPNHGSGHQ